jgi:hypothetical protein
MHDADIYTQSKVSNPMACVWQKSHTVQNACTALSTHEITVYMLEHNVSRHEVKQAITQQL